MNLKVLKICIKKTKCHSKIMRKFYNQKHLLLFRNLTEKQMVKYAANKQAILSTVEAEQSVSHDPLP